MPPAKERDFPLGHPASSDYDPASLEAREWARKNVSGLGERDFPVDHPGAADTAGNFGALHWAPGVDPHNPHREPFTGRTPEQAAAVRALSSAASQAAKESPVLVPIDAVEVAKLLDDKRRELKRDLLTPEEHAAVLAEYHQRARQAPPVGASPGTLTPRERAIAYVMSRGYAIETATAIVEREGAASILEQAGIRTE